VSKPKAKTGQSSSNGSSTFGAKDNKPGFGGKSGGNAFSVFGKQAPATTKSAPSAKSAGAGKSKSASQPSKSLRMESPALSDDAADEVDAIPLERTVSGFSDSSDRGDSPRSGAGQAGLGGSPVEKQVIDQVKRSVANFFLTNELEEVCDLIQDVVHPDGMGEIIKPCITQAFDKRDADRESLTKLLIQLYSKGALRTEQVARGFSAFLDDIDEAVIDVPLAATYAANMLASLVLNEVVNLSFLTQLPEANNFRRSFRAASFIGLTLAAIAKSTSVENAESLFVSSGMSD